jgi:hypothetical protein
MIDLIVTGPLVRYSSPLPRNALRLVTDAARQHFLLAEVGPWCLKKYTGAS